MKPTHLHLAEHFRTVHYHEADEGEALKDMLDPGYWAHVAPRMRPGDHVEIMSSDGGWWALLIVRATERTAAHVKVLQEVALGDAVEPVPEGSSLVPKFRGKIKGWAVMDTGAGEFVREGFQNKDQAISWVTNHLKSLHA